MRPWRRWFGGTLLALAWALQGGLAGTGAWATEKPISQPRQQWFLLSMVVQHASQPRTAFWRMRLCLDGV